MIGKASTKSPKPRVQNKFVCALRPRSSGGDAARSFLPHGRPIGKSQIPQPRGPRQPRIVAGMNTARHEAYRMMLARGFHTDATGIAMHRLNQPAYNRPGVFVIDDWR